MRRAAQLGPLDLLELSLLRRGKELTACEQIATMSSFLRLRAPKESKSVKMPQRALSRKVQTRKEDHTV